MKFILQLATKQRTWLVLLLLVISLFLLDRFGLIRPLTEPIQNILLPVQAATYKTKQDLKNFFVTITEIKGLKEKESQLELENGIMLAENAKLKKLETENKLLKDQLGAKIESRELILSHFIGQHAVFSSRYILDKGMSNKVAKGQIVILKDILIGKICEVSSLSSVVQLPTDSESKIPVITEKGVKGILEGKFGNKLVLTKVLQTQILNEGEVIFTSGEADWPRDLVVGKIAKVNKDPSALFQEAEIKPLVTYESLETVFIILK